MSHAEPLRVDLTLELASADGPPSGRVVVAGTAHPFSGWLGLAVVLQEAVDDAQGKHGRQPDTGSVHS